MASKGSLVAASISVAVLLTGCGAEAPEAAAPASPEPQDVAEEAVDADAELEDVDADAELEERCAYLDDVADAFESGRGGRASEVGAEFRRVAGDLRFMEAPDGWEDRHDWFAEQAGEIVDLAADVEAELDEARREEMARARAEGADEAEVLARGMVAPNYRAPAAWRPVSAVFDAVDDRIEESRADC